MTCLSRAGGGPVASPRKVVEDDKDLAETGVGSDHFLSTGRKSHTARLSSEDVTAADEPNQLDPARS